MNEHVPPSPFLYRSLSSRTRLEISNISMKVTAASVIYASDRRQIYRGIGTRQAKSRPSKVPYFAVRS